jgi:Zn finger protein HypA/HybF involved in hydrogenase expression
VAEKGQILATVETAVVAAGAVAVVQQTVERESQHKVIMAVLVKLGLLQLVAVVVLRLLAETVQEQPMVESVVLVVQQVLQGHL